MMSARLKPFVAGMWAGVAIQVAGRILDANWHASHEEFEATSQQFEAHWLLWLGVLITVTTAVICVIRLSPEQRPGFSFLLAASTFYVAIAVWHFIEHANHNDPAVPHVLLAVGELAIIVAAVVVTVCARRAPPAPVHDPLGEGVP